jgi:hypothetical protein
MKRNVLTTCGASEGDLLARPIGSSCLNSLSPTYQSKGD